MAANNCTSIVVCFGTSYSIDFFLLKSEVLSEISLWVMGCKRLNLGTIKGTFLLNEGFLFISEMSLSACSSVS